MRDGLPSRACLAALLASLLGAASPGSQSPEQAAPAVVPSVAVEIVRLDVVVTEKRGRARADLTREDFVVLEDGQPQPLVHFEVVAAQAPGGPAGSRPAPAETGEDDARPVARPRRYVVLLIDDLHTEFANLARVKKALGRFLEEDVSPDDHIALVTTSGAGNTSQGFTQDVELLKDVVSRLGPRQGRSGWMGVPHLTDYQAELIERGDPSALNAAVQEVIQQGLFLDEASAEQQARSAARAVFAEVVQDSRLTLETLDNVMRGMVGREGRKAILLVSDGFLTGANTGSGFAFDLRRITDAGTRSGVVLYALDSGGLQASAPAASASSRVRVMPSTIGAVEWMRQASEEATRDAMHALAADTGGFLVEDTNDLRAGLRRILRDSETYYVLAYEPTNTRHDGAFRRIEVQVKGLREARVRTRAGYFAPDDRPWALASLSPEAEARHAARRESALQEALEAPLPLTGIPVRLSADFVRGEGGADSVIVSGHVDLKAVPFVRRDDRQLATIDAVAVIHDERGEVVARLPERAAMTLLPKDHEQALRAGLQYQKAAAVKPGRYEVRLVVRDEASGLLGSASQWVQVPDLASGQLTASSLFLLREGEARPAATTAEALDLKSAQALRRYRQADNLYVQLYAYNPRRDPARATSLVAQAQILRDGVVLGTAAPEAMAPGEPESPPQPHTSRIKLSRLDPGDYELRVTVTDRNANAMVVRQVAFTVD